MSLRGIVLARRNVDIKWLRGSKIECYQFVRLPLLVTLEPLEKMFKRRDGPAGCILDQCITAFINAINGECHRQRPTQLSIAFFLSLSLSLSLSLYIYIFHSFWYWFNDCVLPLPMRMLMNYLFTCTLVKIQIYKGNSHWMVKRWFLLPSFSDGRLICLHVVLFFFKPRSHLYCENDTKNLHRCLNSTNPV